MRPPAINAASTASATDPLRVDVSLCASSMLSPLVLSRQDWDAGLERVRDAGSAAGVLWVGRRVLDEVPDDTVRRSRVVARAGVAVPAGDVERGRTDHRKHGT